jgi:ECF transporter S component (folate family)
MQKNEWLRKLVFSGILIAVYIILAKFLSFSTPYAKVNLSFLPIALSAMLFGPWWSMATAAAADIIGTCFFEGGYFPLFTVDAVLYALFYAIFLYKKEKTVTRIVICVLLQTVLVSIPLTPLWICIMNKSFVAYGAALATKSVASVISAVIKIVVLIPTCKYLYPRLQKITGGK